MLLFVLIYLGNDLHKHVPYKLLSFSCWAPIFWKLYCTLCDMPWVVSGF